MRAAPSMSKNQQGGGILFILAADWDEGCAPPDRTTQPFDVATFAVLSGEVMDVLLDGAPHAVSCCFWRVFFGDAFEQRSTIGVVGGGGGGQ